MVSYGFSNGFRCLALAIIQSLSTRSSVETASNDIVTTANTFAPIYVVQNRTTFVPIPILERTMADQFRLEKPVI